MKGRGMVLGFAILIAAVVTGTIAAIFIQQPDQSFTVDRRSLGPVSSHSIFCCHERFSIETFKN